MTDVLITPGMAQSPTERLLEDSWETRERHATQREATVEATATALFMAAAVALLLGSNALATLRPGAAALLVGLYAVVAQIEFPIGAGHVVPTQLVLVPMLMVLPPGAVPLSVGAGMLLGTVVGWTLGRVPGRRVLSAVPDSWHAVGPAAVLLLAGSPSIGFGQLPLLSLAFASCCLVDLVGSVARSRLIGVASGLPLQLRVFSLVWAVDAGLAPLGFLAAIAAPRRGPAEILFVLPLALLLGMLARDRKNQIEKAHARLQLVARERARLQSAVRRLGDAFAAKLELDGLLEILLHGSVEALDAAGGRLELTGGPKARELRTGSPAALLAPEQTAAGSHATLDRPVQIGEGGVWSLRVPLTIAAAPHPLSGCIHLERADRAFEEDEIGLISELITKAEIAGAEILIHEALREQALTDVLTGLGNRRRLSTDLAAALEHATLSQPVLLLLLDLDGFKGYNDAFGHPAGDALLARLAGRLSHVVAGIGTAYRLGGDEFCATFDLQGHDPDKLIARAAAAMSESDSQVSIRASLGAVVLPHEAHSPGQALQLADERMYANKRGRPTGACHQARDVLLRTMHAKHPHLDKHTSLVAELSIRVGRRLGLRGDELDEIVWAAELHDVGKVGIPDAILDKPAALDAAEWEAVRRHTILGERILHAAPALRPVALLVRASHERWDGSGYPDGLRGDEIPLGARIVSVCDAYEAMTTARPYRDAISHQAACAELCAASGTQFDPAVVEAFVATFETAPDQHEPCHTDSAAAHVRTLLEGHNRGTHRVGSRQHVRFHR